MATLEQRIQFTMAVQNEVLRRFGDRNTPIEFTVDSKVFDVETTVAANYGTATLWTAGNGGISTFDFLLFSSDQDLVIELVNTTPNPDERMLVKCRANSIIVLPSQIMGAYASNTTRLDGAALVSGTDYNSINQILVQRDAATGQATATCRLMLVAIS